MTVNKIFLEIDQKSLLVSPSYRDESSRRVEEDPSDSPRRLSCSFLIFLGDPGERWMFSDPDLLQKFSLFHLQLGV